MKSKRIYEVEIENPKAVKAFGELMILLGFEEKSRNEFIENTTSPQKGKK
jgi:hypothetical protein